MGKPQKIQRASGSLIAGKVLVLGICFSGFAWFIMGEVSFPAPKEMYRPCKGNELCRKVVQQHGVKCFEEAMDSDVSRALDRYPARDPYYMLYLECLKASGAENL